FHVLEQTPQAKPGFLRRDDCLRCHISDASLGVPGMMVRSRYPAADGTPKLILGGFTNDHRSPLEERWGGWYVTGQTGGARHMGNTVFGEDDQPRTIPARFDAAGYLSSESDIAALLVFDHQMHAMNLITRMGWETRAALRQKRADAPGVLRAAAKEVVDYLLFVDEAPLPGGLKASPAFAARFAAMGPADRRGRSLRQLDLRT